MDRYKSQPETLRYAQDFSSPILPTEIADVLGSLRAETVELNFPAIIMVSEPQAKLLNALVHIVGTRRILEIGTFTGYSAIAMASALPVSGKLISLDINPDTQAIAARYVKAAGLQDKVELRLGPAADSLEKIAKESPAAQFEFIFIDADKEMYGKYYDLILDNNLLADHGLIICDNVLRGGRVVKAAGYIEDLPALQGYTYGDESQAKAIHEFNVKVASDPRVQSVILPIYDGVSILRKI